MSFGFVIDFRCPPKDALGGTHTAPVRIGEGASCAPDPAACRACTMTGSSIEQPSCMGVVETPLSEAVERWLLARLPAELEGISGQVLRQAVGVGFTGERGAALRSQGALALRRRLERTWGGFFKRFTLTSDQLIEQIFGVGDLEPPHTLALLVQMGLIEIDGKPVDVANPAVLGELAAEPTGRAERTRLLLAAASGGEASLLEVQRFLAAAYSAFCLDVKLLVVGESARPGLHLV